MKGASAHFESGSAAENSGPFAVGESEFGFAKPISFEHACRRRHSLETAP